MAEFRIKHKIEDVQEGIEMVLADSSVLDQEDVLVNLNVKDIEKGIKNQELRKKVRNIQARRGDYIHSYEETTKPLNKYDDAVETSFILKTQVEPQINTENQKKIEKVEKFKKPEKPCFEIPKKRLRIIDLAEGENVMENQLNARPRKVKKIPVFEDEENNERLEIEFKINSIPRPTIKSTPATDEGEEFVMDEDFNIGPKKSLIDPKLSLKDAGTTSVMFVPLPTERIQVSNEEKPANDWDHKDRPLGRGLAFCLNLLRDRKLLGSTKELGRKKDKPVSSETNYFDNKGRPITKKQAFRMQCYSFHNQKPNQTKLKRIEEEIQAELKSNKTDSSLGSTTFRHVKSIMQKTQNPFVVISKN